MINTLQFAQKALIFKDGKLLVVRNRKDAKFNPDMLHFPGGRMNFGEDVDSHIKREVFEETGVTVKPLNPLTISSWTVNAGDDDRKELERINLQVVAVNRACEYIAGEPTIENNKDDENIDTVMWVDAKELLINPKFDKKQIEALKMFIEQYL